MRLANGEPHTAATRHSSQRYRCPTIAAIGKIRNSAVEQEDLRGDRLMVMSLRRKVNETLRPRRQSFAERAAAQLRESSPCQFSTAARAVKLTLRRYDALCERGRREECGSLGLTANCEAAVAAVDWSWDWSAGGVGELKRFGISGPRHEVPGDKMIATSTQANFYTALKFGSKKHFYGRVAPEGILALHLEIDLFTAAERPKLFLVSKCTFTTPSRALSRIKIGLCTCIIF